MEKRVDPGLFVNDGSFMEKFKQLEKEKQEKEKAAVEESKSSILASSSAPLKTGAILNKRPLEIKASNKTKPGVSASGGKLAFSLKQKAKVVAAPVKLGVEEEEDGVEAEGRPAVESVKRQKFGQPEAGSEPSVVQGDAPAPPIDPTVRKVADKLASFVAKNGRQFEHITRQRNPGDTPFKFLFDSGCADYKYYEYQLLEEEKILAQAKDSQASHTANATTSKPSSSTQRSFAQQQSNYQIPASALYETNEEPGSLTATGRAPSNGYSGGPSAADPIAMMEFYMKKAAQEERMRQPKQSKDEMPPPASLLGAPPRKGHHMGDYIPPEELERFMASCNDASAQRSSRETTERSKIQADNVGHRLLSKMGWKEGEGLGSSKSGRADPVMAGNVKKDNLGVGAEQPGEVTADDDIYDQYKKRMMLGYRYRPNPLNNPRKAYY